MIDKIKLFLWMFTSKKSGHFWAYRNNTHIAINSNVGYFAVHFYKSEEKIDVVYKIPFIK